MPSKQKTTNTPTNHEGHLDVEAPSGHKLLLRGILSLDGDPVDALLENFTRLRDAKLEWNHPVHGRIYRFVGKCVEDFGGVPSLSVVSEHFGSDAEVVEELKDVQDTQLRTRTNYGHALSEAIERQKRELFSILLKNAKDISRDGLIVRNDDGTETTRKGLTEAWKYLETKGAKLRARHETGASSPWAKRLVQVPEDWYREEPPKRTWLLTDARTGDGVFPAGKVGLLAAEGGAGKTMAVTQLGIAVATKQPWLGSFLPREAGKVLLILGEEDMEEARRRVHRATREHMAFGPNVSVLPLAGVSAQLVDEDDEPTEFYRWLVAELKAKGPYSLVVIDPISRFAGADTEKDNHAATKFLTTIESLIEPAGGASILLAHHTSQQARGKGRGVDVTGVRGVSGITDATRWVSALEVDRIDTEASPMSSIKLSMLKSNYSMFAAPVTLKYGDGGVLLPATESDRQEVTQAKDLVDPKTKRATAKKDAKSEENARVDAIALAIVTERPGVDTKDLREAISARANIGHVKADLSSARLRDSGLIVRRTEGKRQAHYLGDPAPPKTETNGAGSHFTAIEIDEVITPKLEELQ